MDYCKETLTQDIHNLEIVAEYLVDLIEREEDRFIPDVCRIYLHSMLFCTETDLAKKKAALMAHSLFPALTLGDILGEGNEWEV